MIDLKGLDGTFKITNCFNIIHDLLDLVLNFLIFSSFFLQNCSHKEK